MTLQEAYEIVMEDMPILMEDSDTKDQDDKEDKKDDDSKKDHPKDCKCRKCKIKRLKERLKKDGKLSMMYLQQEIERQQSNDRTRRDIQHHLDMQRQHDSWHQQYIDHGMV